METKDESKDARIQYLQMIQSVIDRMSTTSAIFKGFCATTVTGIFAISFTEINKWILALSLVPILCFLLLDVYYLRLEKRFRALYNSVRLGEKEVDFDLTPLAIKELKIKEAGMWYCIKSPSIYLFYIPVFITSIFIVIIKFGWLV